MIYLELLWSFFQLGLFSFGGGYASLPLIQTPVSYTHLDVYKRQRLSSSRCSRQRKTPNPKTHKTPGYPAKNPAAAQSSAVESASGSLRVTAASTRVMTAAVPSPMSSPTTGLEKLRCSCLLYTSRCV